LPGYGNILSIQLILSEKPDLELGIGGGIHNLGLSFGFFQRSVQAVLAAAIDDLNFSIGSRLYSADGLKASNS
jgi:hypothetical protein